MSGRFSTGVQLKKRHEPNYSGIAANSLFAKALEDESEDEDLRKGKINYVAIGERDRDAEDQFLAEEYVPDDPDEILQDDYDAHFDSIQHRRKLVFQGDKGNKSVRYMEGIKAAADKRKREQTINYEKIAAKQMKREGKDFESKGRYMTEGFKNMLKQNQEFEEKDLEKEQWNQNHSVINKNDMTSFYRRMYNQEMTFGGPRGPIIDETKPGTIEIQLGLENSEEENALETSKTDEKVTNDVAVHENKEESGIPIPGIIKDRSRSGSKERLKKAEQTQADGEDTEKPEKVEIPMSREEKIRLAKERQKQRAAAMSQNLPL